MVAESIKTKTGVEVTRRQMDFEPIRTLGEHKIHIRLTMDLAPEVTVLVHREGEAPALPGAKAEAEVDTNGEAIAEVNAQAVTETVATE
jgi:large subunit ribosomal protein L9